MSEWTFTFMAMMLAGVAVATLFVASLHAGGDEYLDALCSASRRANITANTVQSRRHHGRHVAHTYSNRYPGGRL